LDIPVFHDDQHGTAIVVLAALVNAARVVDKDMTSLRVVVSGAGAAGVAVTNIMLRAGIGDVVVCDSRGIVSPTRTDLVEHKHRLAATTNPRGLSGSLGQALVGADVFIGVSGGQVAEQDIARMASRAIVFALANPDPEVHPLVAARHAEVVATGRSDFPNQINNVLAFPGLFRGAFDSGAPQITEPMKLAAARSSTINLDDVQVGGEFARREVDEGLYRSRWERATTAQRQLLKAMGELGGDKPVAISDLATAMGKRRVSDLSVARNEVIKKGLLYAPERGQLAFTVPGMHTFIAQQD
jgi:malic enzyme